MRLELDAFLVERGPLEKTCFDSRRKMIRCSSSSFLDHRVGGFRLYLVELGVGMYRLLMPDEKVLLVFDRS